MRTWLVILLLGTIAESAAAQDPPFSGVPEAVKGLGSEIFAEREKASAFLFAAGRAAEPALEKARHSNDAEVAIRAREILAKFHWGIYPDTPKGIVAQIEKFKSAIQWEDKKTAFQSILGQRPPARDLHLDPVAQKEHSRIIAPRFFRPDGQANFQQLFQGIQLPAPQ